jgi:carbon-monoxide dehydrogenase small subunit
MKLSLTVNDQPHELDVDPLRALLDLLREDLALIGAHRGCEEGGCGACTVLLDDTPVYACQIPVCQLDGAHIKTVEGLAADEQRLAPLQAALIKAGATGCGYCLPGLLMTSLALRKRTPRPRPEELRALLAGNLCRCTGYQVIQDAVLEVLR